MIVAFSSKSHTSFYNTAQADSKIYMEMRSVKSSQDPSEEEQGGGTYASGCLDLL